MALYLVGENLDKTRSLDKMTAALDVVTLPKAMAYGKEAEATIREMLDICRSRIETLK